MSGNRHFVQIAVTNDGRPIVVPRDHYHDRWSEYALYANRDVTYATPESVARMTPRY